jgi:hypothetical protein
MEKKWRFLDRSTCVNILKRSELSINTVVLILLYLSVSTGIMGKFE